MTTTKDIHSVSANIFFIFTFVYIFAALALRNNFNAGLMIFLMRLLDIPFALVSLLYGGSSLYLQVNNGEEKSDSVWGILIIALCVILFAGVVFINFAFPSKL